MSTALKSSCFVIDEGHLAEQVLDIRAKLAAEGPEILLDFFLAQTLDPAGMRALQELAGAADIENVKIVLRGVNIEMYKALKLAGLSDSFAFVD